MSNSLHHYGWTDDRQSSVPPRTVPARVLRVDGTSVLTTDAHATGPVPIPPRLDPVPTVGDWVAVSEASDSPTIVAVLPRTSLLRRSSADGNREQLLAANVDIVLIACGADRPITTGRVQRAATQAWDAGATPVLVVTKIDAPTLHALDLDRLAIAHPGVRVVATSAMEGRGVEEIRGLLEGSTGMLLGESGAGKSTLTNALLGSEAAATGSVRPGDAKGRHTTSARWLYPVPGTAGGTLIDTPGVRSLGLFADEDSVLSAFGDIGALVGECRFSDCRHQTEPGCAVLLAVDSGELAAERYDAWRKLQREAAALALRRSPHEMRKHAKQFSRAAKEAGARKRT